MNLLIGSAPYTSADDLALGVERVRLADVASARNSARIYRYQNGQAFDGDLVHSDWDPAVSKLTKELGDRMLGVNSFIAVDTLSASGELYKGQRPVVGRHVKKGAPRLPQLIGLRTRNASDEAVKRMCGVDLLLINLHQARAPRSAQLVAALLQARRADQPVIFLSENGSELVRVLEPPMADAAIVGLPLVDPPQELLQGFRIVGRERVQMEQEFDYALPSVELTDSEKDLVSLARAAWRSQWHSLARVSSRWSPQSRFTEELLRLRQDSASSADRFRLVSNILDRLANDSSKVTRDRLQAIVEVLGETAGTTVVIVGNRADEEYLTHYLSTRDQPRVDVTVARHAADTFRPADACIACGYFGPVTIDAILRIHAKKVFWILDPVDAAHAAFECHREAAAFAKLEMPRFADLLGATDQALFSASGNVRRGAAEDHPEIFAPIRGTNRDLMNRLDVDVVGDNPTVLLLLSDGSALRTNRSRFVFQF